MNNVGNIYIYEQQLEQLIAKIDSEIASLEKEYKEIETRMQILADPNVWQGVSQEAFYSKMKHFQNQLTPTIEGLRMRSQHMKDVLANYKKHEENIRTNVDTSIGNVSTGGNA